MRIRLIYWIMVCGWSFRFPLNWVREDDRVRLIDLNMYCY